jgi:hypothetical protein
MIDIILQSLDIVIETLAPYYSANLSSRDFSMEVYNDALKKVKAVLTKPIFAKAGASQQIV